MRFELRPMGPFSLKHANELFGGWPTVDGALVMAMPVEGWTTSAAVLVRQADDGRVVGEVHGADGAEAEQAWHQAMATLSADADGSGFPEVGQRDPVIGRLQERYQLVRPVLFHSPYEAAAAFVIGQRISIKQTRAIRQRMAQELGEAIEVAGTSVSAFPRPSVLRATTSFPGVSAEKIARLHGLAAAALEGRLDRAHLRSLPDDQALEELGALRGIGPFTSQGVLMRGAGLVDTVPRDDVTGQAVQRAYGLPELPDFSGVLRQAEAWRPYRMWATVLLHIWLRREMGGPTRRPGRRRPADGSP